MLTSSRLRVAICALLVVAAGASMAAPGAPPSKRRLVEVRSYNLKPGTRAEFHRLASTVAVPLLKRFQIDVVAHGPSPQDETSYYLIRAFDDLADRQAKEDAFYGSDDWKTGPREAVLAAIESYTTILLEMDEATVKGLRRP